MASLPGLHHLILNPGCREDDTGAWTWSSVVLRSGRSLTYFDRHILDLVVEYSISSNPIIVLRTVH